MSYHPLLSRALMGDYAFGQQRAYRFFNTRLPLEIIEHMMSYAFNPQTQALASQKASKEAFDNDSSSTACQIT